MTRASPYYLLAFMAVVLAGIAPAGAVAPHPTRSPAAPVWRVQCVDCPASYFVLSERGLALDAAGQPHVVFAADSLHYAHHDGSHWQIETVDAAPGSQDIYPSPPSLALDALDLPHISYLSATSRALRYARRTSQGWQTASAPSLVSTGDTHQRPRIAFYDPGWRHLRLAWGEPFGLYLPLAARSQ